MRNRIVVIVIVAALALAAPGSAAVIKAQNGGLSADQLALLERVFEARAYLEVVGSYAENRTGTETQLLTLEWEDQVFEFYDETEWEQAQTVINTAAGTNAQAQVRAAVTGEDWPPYVVSGEVRLVDDVLYVNASYEEPDASLPPLPEGWFAVPDIEAAQQEYPALVALQLDNVSRSEPAPLLENQQLIRDTATDVQLASAELADGTQADQITVTFGRDALLAVMTEDVEDAFQLALFGAMSDASYAALIVTLDAENRPLHVRTEIVLVAEGIDAAALSPDDFPPGMMLSFRFEGVEEQSYRQFNETFEPVAVPEGVATEPAS